MSFHIVYILGDGSAHLGRDLAIQWCSMSARIPKQRAAKKQLLSQDQFLSCKKRRDRTAKDVNKVICLMMCPLDCLEHQEIYYPETEN